VAENRGNYLPPEIYYARLATVYAAAGALITDRAGRVLVVKPNYRDHWLLPGGMVEHDEPPELACARELKEELGLDIPVGPLLVVQWIPADNDRPRPMVNFVFDGGTLDAPERIRLQEEELDDHGFFPVDEATTLLSPTVADRVPAALTARETNTVAYRPWR
jgi:8-oxo-dGTP diphosphatase